MNERMNHQDQYEMKEIELMMEKFSNNNNEKQILRWLFSFVLFLSKKMTHTHAIIYAIGIFYHLISDCSTLSICLSEKK